jgi:hypothetical protein
MYDYNALTSHQPKREHGFFTEIVQLFDDLPADSILWIFRSLSPRALPLCPLASCPKACAAYAAKLRKG